MFKRNDIISDLKEHVAEVTFKKVDGTQRTLRCTLMANHLPPNYNHEHLESMHQRPENLDIVAAWDIKAGGWKSFHVDSVRMIQILDNF
jgi:hypothetical protein